MFCVPPLDDRNDRDDDPIWLNIIDNIKKFCSAPVAQWQNTGYATPSSRHTEALESFSLFLLFLF